MGKRLSDLLATPELRKALVDDGAKLVRGEVERRGGLSGMALKGAFKVVEAVHRDFVAEALDRLLPAFAAKLEPFVDARDRERPGERMERFLSDRPEAVAEALLSITDARVARLHRGPIRTTYDKLRPSAQRYVEDAVPAIGGLLDRHLR